MVAKTGFELITDLEAMLLTLDSLDTGADDYEDSFNHWLRCLEETLSQTSDKMLNYRRVMDLGKLRKKFFADERDRYATRFRVQARVIERVKELAHMMLQSHSNITGKDRMVLEDGTWAKLATRKEYVFYDSETGATELDPAKVGAGFVRMEISKSELKAAAKGGETIPGVNYEQVEKTHVRWS
jgi:hypothetical protein